MRSLKVEVSYWSSGVKKLYLKDPEGLELVPRSLERSSVWVCLTSPPICFAIASVTALRYGNISQGAERLKVLTYSSFSACVFGFNSTTRFFFSGGDGILISAFMFFGDMLSRREAKRLTESLLLIFRSFVGSFLPFNLFSFFSDFSSSLYQRTLVKERRVHEDTLKDK